MNLFDRRHWIFDLDGTLTVAIHDFDGLRDELGIPRGTGLLEWTEGLAATEADTVRARIDAWEREHAELARPEPDAVALLERLHAGGARLGVLTRNTQVCALRTLAVAGLDRFFLPVHCAGRDDAAPKPSPAGVQRLLDLWGAAPSDAVMVGDWIFDVEAGRGAGVATVLVDRDGSAAQHAPAADVYVRSLADLGPG